MRLCLIPAKIVTHFQIVIQRSRRFIWTDATFVEYRFHLCQSWHRKIQQLGLTSEFKDKKSVVGRYLRTHFRIQFLHLRKHEIFLNSGSTLSTIILMRTILPFCKDDLLCRTTNNCEPFHSRFNTSFYQAHLNIYLYTNVAIFKAPSENLFKDKE